MTDSVNPVSGEGDDSATRKPPFLRLFLFNSLYAFGGMAAVIALVLYVILGQNTQLYQATADGWEDISHDLPGTPNLLLTADDGSLWVRTMFRGSISRYADGKWEVHRGDQFRTLRNYPFPGFALDGERCWTVIDEILLCYRQGRWDHVSLLPVNPSADPLVTIAVDSTGVWLISTRGSLWHYDDQRWQSEDLAGRFPSVPEYGPYSWSRAKLELAGDGTQWLAAGSVWRRTPGEPWKEVSIGGQPLSEAALVGRGTDRMWFAREGELVWVALDTESHGRFTALELGLSTEDTIQAVADDGEAVLVATTAGLLALEEDGWAQRPMFDGPSRAADVSLASGGNTWLIVSAPFDPTLLCLVSGGVTLMSLFLSVISWRLCRNESKQSLLRFNITVGAVVVLTIVEIAVMSSALDAVDSDMAPIMWPMAICMLSLPLPLLLVMTRWLQQRASRGLERIVFHAIEERELPPRTLKYFVKHTGEMEALGFRYLRDYRLKRHTPFFCRLFLSDDGRTFGEISTQRSVLFITIRACSFVSMFESGDYLESGNIPGKNQDDGQFHARRAGERPLADVLAIHREQAAALAARHETFAVELEHDDYPVVSTYGYKLLYDTMLREGLVTTNPYIDAVVPKIAEPAAT